MDTTSFFPKTVVNLDGYTVNVDELARRYILIFITLKATFCNVCPQLLLILNHYGLHDNPPTSIVDPFDKSIMNVPQDEIPLNRLLLKQDAFLLVICPGPVEMVRQIRKDCHFSHFPYHFVVDEDLSLATSINLRMMSRNEIWPCIAHISPDTLAIRPVLFGRGPGYYGYKDLLFYLREYREQVENDAENIILDAMKVETRLKKFITTESTQQIIQTDQPQQEQILPIELLTHIFEYLEPMEIIKTVTAVSRLWRAIGLEVIVIILRSGIKNSSESLVTYPRTETNQMPYFSRILLLKQKNKLVGIYELNQQIKNLTEIVKISQCYLIHCKD